MLELYISKTSLMNIEHCNANMIPFFKSITNLYDVCMHILRCISIQLHEYISVDKCVKDLEDSYHFITIGSLARGSRFKRAHPGVRAVRLLAIPDKRTFDASRF